MSWSELGCVAFVNVKRGAVRQILRDSFKRVQHRAATPLMPPLEMIVFPTSTMWCVLWMIGAHAATLGGPGSRTPRPALLRLRGGEETAAPLILRLHSKDGTKRIVTPGGQTTLLELQQLIRTQLHIPPSKQVISLQPGGEPLALAGSGQTLAELGLAHGSTLHLSTQVSVDTAGSSRRAPPAARRVTVDVTKEMSDKRAAKVVMSGGSVIVSSVGIRLTNITILESGGTGFLITSSRTPNQLCT